MSTLIERVETAEKLLRILLAFCPAPAEYQIGVWVRQFSDAELEYAFNRASRKFAPTKGPCPPAHTVHRYVTGILANEKARKEVVA